MCFSPRGSVWSFEGWILLRISLGLAVRSFWNDLGKFPKSASGEIWGDILARGPFWSKKWSRKMWFCGGMILWWGFRGNPPAQMNSMVPGTHMGRLLCPKPSLFNYFVGISTFPGKSQVAPVTYAILPDLWSPVLHSLEALDS